MSFQVSFQKWLEQNSEFAQKYVKEHPSEPYIICPDCNGERICKCSKCNSSHKCHTCEGLGHLPLRDPYEELMNRYKHDQYLILLAEYEMSAKTN